MKFTILNRLYRAAMRNSIRMKIKGVSMLEKIILLAVSIFVLAFIFPPALTAIATSALTSVNTAVQTLFQLLVSIIAVVAIILLIYYETVRGSTT